MMWIICSGFEPNSRDICSHQYIYIQCTYICVKLNYKTSFLTTSLICSSSRCGLHWQLSGPMSLWLTYRMEVGVLVKAEWSRGEQESQPGIPLCSMPAPGPVLIQHIMSKLLLAAAPIETLIKAIRGSSWGGAGGWEDVVNSGYVGTGRGERERDRRT